MNSISIIIPVYNEGILINNLIDHINGHARPPGTTKDERTRQLFHINRHGRSGVWLPATTNIETHMITRTWKEFHIKNIEIIVVDGDKGGSTIKKINDNSVIKLIGSKGRSNQMNLGSEYAKNDILLFLHADSLLPEKTFSSIIDAMHDSQVKAGAFDLCIDSKNILLKIIEKIASIRSRVTQIPYGDQGIFIKKKIFQEINGYSNIPLMEDIDLMQKLKRKKYKISILDKKIKTSPRRWEEQGIIFCSIRNIIISSLFYLGVNAVTLKKYY